MAGMTDTGGAAITVHMTDEQFEWFRLQQEHAAQEIQASQSAHFQEVQRLLNETLSAQHRGIIDLRERFAGQALAGLLTRADIVGTDARITHVKDAVADIAVSYADALIAALAARTSGTGVGE